MLCPCHRYSHSASHNPQHMLDFIEKLISSLWNRIQGRRKTKPEGHGVTLGFQVVEETVTARRVTLSQTRRTMHIAVLGKTGSGKSSLLRYLCLQDIAAGRGFLFFDLHGEDTKFLLRAIAAR